MVAGFHSFSMRGSAGLAPSLHTESALWMKKGPRPSSGRRLLRATAGIEQRLRAHRRRGSLAALPSARARLGLELIGEIMHVDHCGLHARAGQPVEHMVDERAPGKRHERLRHAQGERSHALAIARGKHHRRLSLASCPRPSQRERRQVAVCWRELARVEAREARQAPDAQGRAQDSARPAGYERDSRACRHVSPIAQRCRESSSCVGRRALRRARRTDRSKNADLLRASGGTVTSESLASSGFRNVEPGILEKRHEIVGERGRVGRPGNRGCRPASGLAAQAATSSSASDNHATPMC